MVYPQYNIKSGTIQVPLFMCYNRLGGVLHEVLFPLLLHARECQVIDLDVVVVGNGQSITGAAFSNAVRGPADDPLDWGSEISTKDLEDIPLDEHLLAPCDMGQVRIDGQEHFISAAGMDLHPLFR